LGVDVEAVPKGANLLGRSADARRRGSGGGGERTAYLGLENWYVLGVSVWSE